MCYHIHVGFHTVTPPVAFDINLMCTDCVSLNKQRVGKKPRDNLFGAEHQSCILKATVELIIYKSWGCLVN